MKSVCDVIKKACLTEKGMALQEEHNQIVVKVDKVRTANMHGKMKRVGKHMGRRNDWKKAVVSLSEGHKIDFLEDL
jgi:large subunit ribosomal protein L23